MGGVILIGQSGGGIVDDVITDQSGSPASMASGSPAIKRPHLERIFSGVSLGS